ncbi:MAG TPA: nucleoside hydrolase [Bryobacteraceae bacterium]|nr:nucleoside hydrolase [Bryobacteraceae bacterium]
MQLRPQVKPPLGVIFDCDLGNSIDDALALALLYGFDGKNEARAVAVSVTKPNLKAAAFCDAIGRFYAGEVSGAFGAGGRTLPVGLATGGKMPEDTPMLSEPLAKRTPEGKPVYPNGVATMIDTADPMAVIRNALTSQHPQNCVMVLTGPATNFAKVLALPGVKELVVEKAKALVIAAGSYPDGGPEPQIKLDIEAATKLFAEWPGLIVTVGQEIGDKLLYPAASIEKDYAWSPAHPVVDAYRAYKTMPYDAPASAMAALLYAVRPQEGYFKLSEPGVISVQPDGATKFSASATGKHRYLILDETQQEKIIKTYTEVASAKPVPRPRFRRPMPQDQQQQTPPPAATPAKPPAA